MFGRHRPEAQRLPMHQVPRGHEAMDMRSETQVIPLLVTQTPLPGDLADLVRRYGIRHFKAPGTLG